MSYTILSAVYADPDGLSAAVSTAEAGRVLLSSTDTPFDWAALLESQIDIEVFPTVAATYRLFKSVFISRLADDEAVAMEAVLEGADAKLRLMFNSVEYFVTDDPLFVTLQAAVGAALTPERAAMLLAP